MDINEKKGEGFHRHPWELARTRCVISEIAPFIEKVNQKASFNRYLNIGAGDLYFDRHLQKIFRDEVVHAVDIGYKTMPPEADRGKAVLYDDFEKVEKGDFDFALMMDSLEYMVDDKKTLNDVFAKVRTGGYVFLTLPAYSFLLSEHDVNVGNLRRYDRKSIKETLSAVNADIKIEGMHYFFTSLFLVRLVEKLLRIPVDPEGKVTTAWKYKETSIASLFVDAVLTIDYAIGKLFAGFLPGLSLMVICKKRG